MPARPPHRPPRRPPPATSVGNPAATPADPATAGGGAAGADGPSTGLDGPLIDRFEQWRESLEGRAGGDALPAPMLDGYLCGVLLQPRAVPLSRWWPPALDPEGGAPPPAAGPAAQAVEAMRRVAIDRHAALEAAISERRWFDPWVIAPSAGSESVDPDAHDFDGADDSDDNGGLDAMPDAVREAVYPWVAGFAHAMACFQDLLELADPAAAEPQALLCQFLEADDLEDAEALLELIETLEPPTELGDAVEMLVRATLLLADITRPRAVPASPAPGAGRHRQGPGGPRRPAGGPPRRRHPRRP